jgi:stage V sporulation protein S
MTTHTTDRFQREQLEAQHAPAVELEASVGGATGARMQREGNEVLKVSAHSRPNAVAGAIANIVRHQGAVEIQSVGAGATNQAIKAIAIAHSYLSGENIGIFCRPSFADVLIDGQERTAIRLLVERT